MKQDEKKKMKTEIVSLEKLIENLSKRKCMLGRSAELGAFHSIETSRDVFYFKEKEQQYGKIYAHVESGSEERGIFLSADPLYENLQALEFNPDIFGISKEHCYRPVDLFTQISFEEGIAAVFERAGMERWDSHSRSASHTSLSVAHDICADPPTANPLVNLLLGSDSNVERLWFPLYDLKGLGGKCPSYLIWARAKEFAFHPEGKIAKEAIFKRGHLTIALKKGGPAQLECSIDQAIPFYHYSLGVKWLSK